MTYQITWGLDGWRDRQAYGTTENLPPVLVDPVRGSIGGERVAVFDVTHAMFTSLALSFRALVPRAGSRESETGYYIGPMKSQGLVWTAYIIMRILVREHSARSPIGAWAQPDPGSGSWCVADALCERQTFGKTRDSRVRRGSASTAGQRYRGCGEAHGQDGL